MGIEKKDGRVWYSICSRHREYDNTCEMCSVGSWKNEKNSREEKFWEFMYDWMRWIWIWWMNKPSKKEKWLKSFEKREMMGS